MMHPAGGPFFKPRYLLKMQVSNLFSKNRDHQANASIHHLNNSEGGRLSPQDLLDSPGLDDLFP
tara:strand:+ start:4915 stop:5106 length:192 start_codon:yes stop_codon:yes gene_type:complete